MIINQRQSAVQEQGRLYMQAVPRAKVRVLHKGL